MKKQLKIQGGFIQRIFSLFAVAFFIFPVFGFLSPLAMAEDVYNSANPKGWLWYNVKPKPKKSAPEKNKNQSAIASPTTGTEELKAFQSIIGEAKAEAVLHPTEENIKNYLILQNYATNNASTFTNVWKKTLLDYPELDYGITHSPNNNAQHIYYEQEGRKEKEAIQYYAQNYGLFFFYRGQNSVDTSLAPTVVSFARENHIALIPISVDQTPISSLPDTRLNHGQAEKMNIRYFPALVLVNPKNGSFVPLGYGFFSQDELSHRFLEVATGFQGAGS